MLLLYKLELTQTTMHGLKKKRMVQSKAYGGHNVSILHLEQKPGRSSALLLTLSPLPDGESS
jgi:hypothetical protein